MAACRAHGAPVLPAMLSARHGVHYTGTSRHVPVKWDKAVAAASIVEGKSPASRLINAASPS